MAAAASRTVRPVGAPRTDAVQGQGGGHLRPRSPTASDGRLQRLVLDTGRAAASRSRHARTRQ
jgi:hypothetical protein